jgi:hypothetical protein
VREPIFAFNEAAPTSALSPITNISVFLPPKILNYRSQPGPISSLMVRTLPPDTTFGRRLYYRQTNEISIDCQVVLMGADRTSIHQPQFCLEGSGFVTLSSESTTIRIPRPHPYDLPVMKLKLRRESVDGNGRRFPIGGVFVYWFVADNALTADHGERVWWMARDLLRTGVLQRWAYIICSKSCPVGAEDETFEEMKDFIAACVPEFQLTAGPPVTNVAVK